MWLKIVFCFVLVLFVLTLGSCQIRTDNARCFNAQVQDAHFVIIPGELLVRSVRVWTINDTTAVKQIFHLDYFHPVGKTWTSYQENRRTMFFSLPAPLQQKLAKKIIFADAFVAKSMRVSLKKSDAVSWLGEICAQFFFEVEKAKAPSCGKGFYGDGKFCLDINECADSTGNFCPPQQHCNDYPGGYSCPGTCLENKLPNSKTKVCEDHCYHKGYLCHPKARCLYEKCVCDSGYEGDGTYCLDSCTAKGFICDSNANCAEGKCKCREGYQGNGEICQAICHFNLKLCHPSAVCHLNACKCWPGYVGDGISKCIFSRKLYEKEMKKQSITQTRLDIVETDVFECLSDLQQFLNLLLIADFNSLINSDPIPGATAWNRQLRLVWGLNFSGYDFNRVADGMLRNVQGSSYTISDLYRSGIKFYYFEVLHAFQRLRSVLNPKQ